MSLKPIRPNLRTIHNGSNAVAKAQINVPAGGELTVPEVVAEQLQRDSGAFKDGETPQAFLDALAEVAVLEAVVAQARDEDPAPVEPEAKPARKRKG